MDKIGRAYSILDSKAVEENDDFYIVTGIASTPSPDRMGDVVEPLGAKFKTPMPLLWQHDSSKPVGNMTFAAPTEKGIPFRAEIPKVQEAGTLKDRVDEAVQSLKYKLVSAVSIGFRVLEDGYEVLETGALRVKEWEWLELSLVTIPANSEAMISAVKSIDSETLSASGVKGEAITNPSGGTDKPQTVTLHPRRYHNEPDEKTKGDTVKLETIPVSA